MSCGYQNPFLIHKYWVGCQTAILFWGRYPAPQGDPKGAVSAWSGSAGYPGVRCARRGGVIPPTTSKKPRSKPKTPAPGHPRLPRLLSPAETICPTPGKPLHQLAGVFVFQKVVYNQIE